ncbi:hypothetical protein [Cohnella herbarum]|uniref:Uncharacterized protein n=1 Tax=Cohnella herbarum TaxID=2728023 RepID=A0A7Z2VP02_9BACL|nr:hypothetical protein [Cohnella herbarum]QJD86444.1 hypothetical protein HH215_26965 [Cohnella herbarum]
MALALELAKTFIQNKLQAMAMTHLHVRRQGRCLIVYSVEWDEVAIRAILTLMPRNDFVLSIANHRGKWQLIPLVGPLPEMMAVLTEDLAFSLARWPNSSSNRFYESS